MNKILAVRNHEQKVLWDQELSGQISDGAWENSRPYDHYKPWCDAEVVVDPENVGRNFYANRDSYGFTRRDLLDVVSRRMLATVRFSKAFGWDLASKAEDYIDLSGFFEPLSDLQNRPGDYWKNIIKAREERNIEQKAQAVISDETIYSIGQMLTDLRDLKKIIKMRRGETET